MEYVPVVDVSKHQGAIDFAVMHARGVRGVIVRAGNGVDPDPLCDRNVRAAQAVGLDVGVYWFCNPRIGTPELQGSMLAQAHVAGGCNLPPMLDVESFALEKHELPVPSPAEFAAWLHVFVTVVDRVRQPFFYSNGSYWNPNVGDRTFGDYDIIVARYPFYAPAACAAHVPPVNAESWASWIMAETTARPQMPNGWTFWSGWQFSAGFNGRAATYGCSGDDLDLNIIRADVYARWLNTAPPHVGGVDVNVIPTNAEPRVSPADGQSYEPGKFVFIAQLDGTLRHVVGFEGRLYDGLPRVAFSNAELDEWLARTAKTPTVQVEVPPVVIPAMSGVITLRPA